MQSSGFYTARLAGDSMTRSFRDTAPTFKTVSIAKSSIKRLKSPYPVKWSVCAAYRSRARSTIIIRRIKASRKTY